MRQLLYHPTAMSSLVFLSAAAWGLYWWPLRYLEGEGISGGWAIALLNVPGILFLGAVTLFRWRENAPTLKIALLAGMFTGVAMGLYATGLIYSSVVRVTLLFYLTPVWATVIERIWMAEPITLARGVAIALGLVGLILLVSGEGGSTPLNIGDIMGFLSGLAWAIGATIIKRFNTVPITGLATFQFSFAALSALVLSTLAGPFVLPSIAQVYTAFLPALGVSFLLLLPSVWIIFWAQQYLSAGRVGLLMMSEVMVAIITASLFIPEEHMPTIAWGGAILIIAACLVEVAGSKKA